MFFSLHAPTTKDSYANEVYRILDKLNQVVDGRPCVIGGDFNLTVTHHADADRPTRATEHAIHTRLRDEFNLINCWQAANSDLPLAQTLRWSSNKDLVFHCDGIFVPSTWTSKLINCDVLTGPEWESLSDHSPVIATFEL